MSERRNLAGQWIGFGLGVVLIYSSIGHLENPYAFLASIRAYQILSRELALLAAAVLPHVELSLGIAMLLFPKFNRTVFPICIVLFGCFSTAQILALWRGLDISCGCFKSLPEEPISWVSIGFTSSLFGLACTGVILNLCCNLRAQE